jgi:hypothetical protein
MGIFAALSFPFGPPFPPAFYRLLPLSVPALLTGVGQWLVLRRHVSRAGWWVFASAVGGAVGWSAVLLVTLAMLVWLKPASIELIS